MLSLGLYDWSRIDQPVAQGLREAYACYQRPVWLTETSAGSTTAARVAYSEALGEMLQNLRRDRVPIVGVHWWPLFSAISWEYRDMPDVPVTDFLKLGFNRLELNPAAA